MWCHCKETLRQGPMAKLGYTSPSSSTALNTSLFLPWILAVPLNQEFPPFQLEEALCSFSAHLTHQDHHFLCGPLLSKVRVTWSQAMWYLCTDLITDRVTKWLMGARTSYSGTGRQVVCAVGCVGQRAHLTLGCMKWDGTQKNLQSGVYMLTWRGL